MTKEDAISQLELLEKELQELESSLIVIGANIYNINIRNKARKVSRQWFEDTEPSVTKFGVLEPVLRKYDLLFDKLLKLSLRVSRKNTYLHLIQDIRESFKDELLAPVLRSPSQAVLAFYTSNLSEILDGVSEDEKEYLSEALGCASNGFLRASIVLGWSAAVHRLHKVVEKIGFDEFNRKSVEMKNIKTGRFSRFNKSFSVHSLSELNATVFDNDLLWVIEYIGLIDSNQHERLSICFTMRNNSAHPGEAPIAPENLASFYSDLKNMIFANPKFIL